MYLFFSKFITFVNLDKMTNGKICEYNVHTSRVKHIFLQDEIRTTN